MIFIRADDALHQHMPHDVAFVEVVERDAVHAFEHFGSFDESAAAGVWQIDLRDVSGDHCLGVEAETRHEHLHLL